MDDLEFVQKCVKGDNQTRKEFITRYSRLIYSYVSNTISLKAFNQFHQDVVQDIVHDLFVSLVSDNYRKLATYQAKNGCTLASWLRRVTIHFTIDYIRKFKPHLSLDQENNDGVALKDVIPDRKADIQAALQVKEKISQLKECIGKLDVDERFFLELHLNRDLSLDELKGVLGIARGAVDMRKVRIIERLKECFKRKGFLLD